MYARKDNLLIMQEAIKVRDLLPVSQKLVRNVFIKHKAIHDFEIYLKFHVPLSWILRPPIWPEKYSAHLKVVSNWRDIIYI